MAKLEVVPYEAVHLARLRPRSCHSKEAFGEIGTPAVSVMDGTDPLGIIGGFQVDPGILHAWALLSDQILRSPVAFTKAVKKLADHWLEDKGMRRIQIAVRVDHPAGRSWAQVLGFKVEGVLKHYGPDGADYFMMGRTRWVQ